MPRWRVAKALTARGNWAESKVYCDEIYLTLTGRKHYPACSKPYCQYEKKYAYIQQHLNKLGLLS